MSNDANQLAAVRAFAEHTERAATILECSFADAAMFLMKLGPMMALLQDPIFQDQFARYMKGIATQPVNAPGKTPQGKGIH